MSLSDLAGGVVSVEELVRGVNAAISQLPTGALEEAHQALEAAQHVLSQIAQGSQADEMNQALGFLSEALSGLEVVYQHVARAKDELNGYLTKVGTVMPPEPTPARREQPRKPNQPATSGRLSGERVKELKDELPMPVPKPNPESKKTHGRWVDGQGKVQRVVSGEDQYSEAASALFKKAGVPPNKKLAIVTHAEVKVVAQMIEAGQKHSEIIVNNRPCPGPLGCDALLPVILPEGSSLTVHGPNYRKTFTGGKQW
jgi:hypothetical protein